MASDFDVKRYWETSWGPACPFHADVLNVELRAWDIEAGTVTLHMPYRPCFDNSGVAEEAVVHGGVLASFVDVCTGFALAIKTEGKGGVTVNLQVDCLAPARRTALTGTARTVKCGRKIGVAEVDIVDESGKRVATGRQTCFMG
jgi:uncharacterized protein (TIGR00369 family)